MTIATGAFKRVAIKKESVPGTFAGASGAQELRRNSFDGNINIVSITSNEIRTDQQTAVHRGGAITSAGTLLGDLIPGAWQIPLQSAMRRDFTAGVSLTATDIAAVAATGFTSVAAAFLTTGFKVGDIVSPSGFSGGAVAPNGNGNRYIVSSVVAGTMNVLNMDGSAATLAADAVGESVTIAVVGRKNLLPRTAHTDEYYSIEEFHDDINQSIAYLGTKMNGFTVTVDPAQITTISFPVMGLGQYSVSTSEQFTTPTAGVAGDAATGTSGALVVGAASVTNVTGVTFTLDGGLTTAAVVGSRYSPSVFAGRLGVTGQYTVFFEDRAEFDAFVAETEQALILVQTTSPSLSADFVQFCFPRHKITSFTKNDTETGGCIATCQFIALVNTAGGTGISSEATSMSVQDSDAV
jgi:hypothetical protein